MNKFYKYLIPVVLALAVALPLPAQDDDSQAELRENPEMETPTAPAASRVNYPGYIRLSRNHIQMNGADWSDLRERFSQADDSLLSIVHVGDSHLQADMATAVTRIRLQQIYGGAGRGLIVPFKLAGTNQPNDYSITSPDVWAASRLLKKPWPVEMTFTGIGIDPAKTNARLEVKSPTFFDTMTFFCSQPGMEVQSVSDGAGDAVPFLTVADGNVLSVSLVAPQIETTVAVSCPQGLSIGGISLTEGTNGLRYHVIGNNGATYDSYLQINSFGRDLQAFNPDLVIISLGCNEAFGKISDSTFRASIDGLVKEIRRQNPQARFLLVTPAECQRRTRKRVKRKGRKRRYVTSYTVNTNVKRMRDVIMAYGRDNNIPVYDWYDVAGGTGSSAHWIKDNTLNKDRVHLTYKGYQLQGNLFTDALLEAVTQQSNSIK